MGGARGKKEEEAAAVRVEKRTWEGKSKRKGNESDRERERGAAKKKEGKQR